MNVSIELTVPGPVHIFTIVFDLLDMYEVRLFKILLHKLGTSLSYAVRLSLRLKSWATSIPPRKGPE